MNEHINKNTGYSKRFGHIMTELLQLEGGYVNRADDMGGETKYGISKKSYGDVDIQNLTKEDAVEIYWNDWYKPYEIYEQCKSYLIAEIVFVTAVNVGRYKGHSLLQEVVNKVYGNDGDGTSKLTVDGYAGPVTTAVVNEAIDEGFGKIIYASYQSKVCLYYLGLNKPQFMRGWLKRIRLV